MSSTQTQPETVVYNTFSICPICAFMEKKGFEWQKAVVVERGNDVWFVLKCATHGDSETYYCSNAKFFRKVLTFLPGALENAKGSVFNIDELKKRIAYQVKDVYNQPLVMDVNLFQARQFVEDEALKEIIANVSKIYPPNKNYILRVAGNLVEDIPKLNDKVRFILDSTMTHTLNNPVLLELTFERLIMLSKRDDSILLNPRVHPSVKLYVQKGNESQDERELSQLFDELRGITNLHVVVTLVIRRPYPDLTGLIKLVREQVGLVRYVVFHLERSPDQIMQNFKAPAQGLKDDAHNVDPYEFLELVQHATNNEISVDDFFPATVGMVLEPFVSLLGMGNYFIRPSPFDGFGTLLLNTERFKSVPASRAFDINKLYNDMIPIAKSMQKSDGKLGYWNAWSIKKAVKNSILKEAQDKIPSDLFSYVTDKNKAEIARATIRNSQMFIIHNNMDVALVDAVRRSRCTVCMHAPSSPTGIAASCTLCI